MKILYLHQYFNGPNESGGTRSYEFARRWAGKGHAVHVVTTDQSMTNTRRGWQEEVLDGIRIHRISISYDNSLGFVGRMRAFLHFAVAAGERAASIGGDIVFATSTPLTIAIPGVRTARALRVPMVFEVRDLWPDVPIAMRVISNPVLKYLARRLEKFAYAWSAQIVALSPGMREGIIATGVDPNIIHTIPNACDVESFSSGDASHFLREHPELIGRRLVLYAGTFGDVNGVEYMVRIAERMASVDENIAFVLVGKGKHQQELKSQARDMGILGVNLFMFPPIPKASMPNLLAACTLSTSFVIENQALWNNSANKVFDAMAATRPVVINHGGWLADLIDDYKLGCVIPANDPTRAAIDISNLIRNEAEMECMRRNAAKVARERFGRDELSDALLTILEDTYTKNARRKAQD